MFTRAASINRRRAEKHLVRRVSTFVDRVFGGRTQMARIAGKFTRKVPGSKFPDSVKAISGFSDRQTLPGVPAHHQNAPESFLVRLSLHFKRAEIAEMAGYLVMPVQLFCQGKYSAPESVRKRRGILTGGSNWR